MDGEVTYKKIQTTQLIGSIQLGVHHAVGSLANVPHRDLLMQDFMTVGKSIYEYFLTSTNYVAYRKFLSKYNNKNIKYVIFFQILCTLANPGPNKPLLTITVTFDSVPMHHLRFEPSENCSQLKQICFLPAFALSL